MQGFEAALNQKTHTRRYIDNNRTADRQVSG